MLAVVADGSVVRLPCTRRNRPAGLDGLDGLDEERRRAFGIVVRRRGREIVPRAR